MDNEGHFVNLNSKISDILIRGSTNNGSRKQRHLDHLLRKRYPCKAQFSGRRYREASDTRADTGLYRAY